MKNPMFWLIAVTWFVLGIAGLIFLSTATARYDSIGDMEARLRSLVAGISCLVLATGILAVGAFIFRKAGDSG